MRASETEQQHVMNGGHGNTDLSMNWDLHYPELGNTVEVITQYMRVVVWLNHESFAEDVSPSLLQFTSVLCVPREGVARQHSLPHKQRSLPCQHEKMQLHETHAAGLYAW